MRRTAMAAAAACIMLAAAAPAGAERITPEFGRCVKAPRGETGAGYSDSHCTKPVAEGAAFHWLAGPGAHPGFQASTGSVTLTLLSSGKGRPQPVIQCGGSKASGEFSGTATETLELALTGCKMSAAVCQSTGAAAGEVVFSPLEGAPEVIRSTEQGEAVIRWEPALGEVLASFECGGTPVTITQSMLHGVRDDRMSKLRTGEVPAAQQRHPGPRMCRTL